jgi:glucosamine kinase
VSDGCVLAVDLGKSWCRLALLAVDPVRRDVRPPAADDVVRGPGAVGLAEADGVGSAVRAVEAALGAAGSPTRAGGLLGVGVGAAGATAAPAAARALAEALAAATGAPAAVTSDAVTSHAGALGGRSGVVLAIGTGAVAVAVAHDDAAGGHVELVDGWGQWLGDEGSGAWLGQQGLRAALRAQDGRGPGTALRAAARQDLGPLDHLPAVLAAGDLVRTTASFAPRVLEAAGAGDEVARAIVSAAAAHLADSTLAAVRRCRAPGPTPVTVVGGLRSAGPLLLDPWRAAVTGHGPAVEVVEPLGDSLAGAARLALRRDLPHEAAVVRADLPLPLPLQEDQ